MDWLRVELPQGGTVRLAGRRGSGCPRWSWRCPRSCSCSPAGPFRRRAALAAPVALVVAAGLLARSLDSRIACCAACRWPSSCSARSGIVVGRRPDRPRARARRKACACSPRSRCWRSCSARGRREPPRLLLPRPAHARAPRGEGPGDGARVLRLARRAAIAEHGVWRTEAYGRTYAFPYTPAFHLPFAAPRPALRHAARWP